MGLFIGLRNAIIIQLLIGGLLLLGYHLVYGQTPGISVQFEHGGEPDLAGFRLYWGTESGTYTDNTTILLGAYQAPPLWMQLPIALDAGTYYMAVTAYDTSDNESGYSNEVQVDIPDQSPGEPTNIRFKIILKDGTEIVFEVSQP